MTSEKLGENEYDFKINGGAVEQTAFKNIYQEAIGIAVNGLADPKLTGEAEITLKYTYNNGKSPDTIKLISAGERYFAISINGKIDWQTEKKNINLMLEHLREAVKSN
jgi:hypothetical protein